MPLVKLTVTPAKLAANRANGRKSHGPRTYQGRRRVALNALRHGHRADRHLFRSRLLAAGEEAGLYDWIYAQTRDAFLPVGKTARRETEQMAQQVWCFVRESGRRRTREGQEGGEPLPRRASLWCHFRIPTRLNRGLRTNPRYAVKSIDTYLTSQLRFEVNGPREGFRTCLRLKFWARRRRRQ